MAVAAPFLSYPTKKFIILGVQLSGRNNSKVCVCFPLCINNIIHEKGNVLFFQLQFGTYLPTFRLDALAILRYVRR